MVDIVNTNQGSGGALATLADPTIIEERSALSFRFSKRTWLAIGAVTLLAALLGLGVSFLVPKQYAVTRTLIVMSGNNSNDNDTLIRSFEAIMGHKGFATELKARTDIDLPVETLKSMISVDRPALSANLEVTTRSEKLALAKTVSDEIIPTLQEIVESGQKSLPIESRIPGPIVQEVFATPTIEEVYVPWFAGLLTAAGLGFLLSFLAATFRQYRKPVIGTARDVGSSLDIPVLARISAVGDGRGTNPQDAVLGMLSAIERLGARGPIHRLVVVGPESDVERSKLILALGCAIARNFDQPVALVDADLENFSLTRLVGASDEPGLAECLAGRVAVEDAMLQLEEGYTPAMLEGLIPPTGMIRILPAGVDRSGNILRMCSNLHEVLGELSGNYVVVVDGPQIPGPVPSGQLMSLADATIVVVTEGSTSLRDARFTGDALRSLTSNPVGAVVIRR